MDVPVLETERLRLRGYRLADFPLSLAIYQNPEVTRYLGTTGATPQQAWTRVIGYVGHWELLGFGYWAVEEKATGEYVGSLGFGDFKRDLPALQGVPEAGWVLRAESHGKGYATEGLRAALAWGDRKFSGGRTVCIIEPENQASLRLAEKLGYCLVESTKLDDTPILLFERRSGNK